MDTEYGIRNGTYGPNTEYGYGIRNAQRDLRGQFLSNTQYEYAIQNVQSGQRVHYTICIPAQYTNNTNTQYRIHRVAYSQPSDTEHLGRGPSLVCEGIVRVKRYISTRMLACAA